MLYTLAPVDVVHFYCGGPGVFGGQGEGPTLPLGAPA